MSMFRRTGAIALSALVVSAFLVIPSPASAQTVQTRAESFIATANARALNLEILGLKVTVGASGIEMTSAPAAKATGGGVLLVPGTVSTVQTTGPSQVLAPPKACVLNLPLAGLLNLQLACGEAKVDSTPGAPQAFGSGSVAAIDVGGQQILALLAPVLDALAPLLDQVLGTVTGALTPIVGNLLGGLVGGAGLDLNAPVSSLVDIINNATNLATIKLGNSTSQGLSETGKVSAIATAQGGQIDVLPGLALGGAPLLSIIVGSAKATSVFDRSGGTSTPGFDAAILTVKLGLPILGGLTEIPVKLGAPAHPAGRHPARVHHRPRRRHHHQEPRRQRVVGRRRCLHPPAQGHQRRHQARAGPRRERYRWTVAAGRAAEDRRAGGPAGQDRQRPVGPDGRLRPPAGRLHHPSPGRRPAQWQPQPLRPLGPT